jgi:hypothetical protein
VESYYGQIFPFALITIGDRIIAAGLKYLLRLQMVAWLPRIHSELSYDFNNHYGPAYLAGTIQ